MKTVRLSIKGVVGRERVVHTFKMSAVGFKSKRSRLTALAEALAAAASDLALKSDSIEEFASVFSAAIVRHAVRSQHQ